MMFLVPNIIRQKIEEVTFSFTYSIRVFLLKKTHLGLDSCCHPSETTTKWLRPKYDIYFQIHTYSIQNADQIIQHRSAAPLVQEKGPYSFKFNTFDIIPFNDGILGKLNKNMRSSLRMVNELHIEHSKIMNLTQKRRVTSVH
jgi:hypothetical protein